MRRPARNFTPPQQSLTSLWMLSSFALILLTLFSALNAHRVPATARQQKVLQSVADKFRPVVSLPAQLKPQTLWKERISDDGVRTLITTFATLFSDDGALTAEGQAALREILPDLLKGRSVLEIESLIPQDGIGPHTLYPSLLRGEVRAQHVKDYLSSEGLPLFLLNVKSSLHSGPDALLELRIRPAHERNGWW